MRRRQPRPHITRPPIRPDRWHPEAIDRSRHRRTSASFWTCHSARPPQCCIPHRGLLQEYFARCRLRVQTSSPPGREEILLSPMRHGLSEDRDIPLPVESESTLLDLSSSHAATGLPRPDSRSPRVLIIFAAWGGAHEKASRAYAAFPAEGRRHIERCVQNNPSHRSPPVFSFGLLSSQL